MSSATVTPPPQPQPQVQPPAARMTAEEFGDKHSGDHVEYINGEVKEIPMPTGTHGKVCYRATIAVGNFVDANDLGHMFTHDTFVKTPTKDDLERVYGPDICYVAYTRLAKDAAVPNVIPIPPDLIIEVRSPSDTWSNVVAKMLDYLRAGVPVVVILDPKTKSASVFCDQDRQDIFEADESLTLPDVLPGFAVPVASLFA